MQPHVLTRTDSRPIPENTGEVRAFMHACNEILRLPYLLKYYRNMGVTRFLVMENHSTDGTLEYLQDQPDCHVFTTSNSFSEARSGITWTAALLNRYGTGHWCLTIDADELLIYPHCEEVKLPQLCAYLEEEGSEGLFTFMMDMYPEGKLEDAVCTPDKSFFEIAPYFDKDYTFIERIHLRGSKPFPPLEVMGGPRERCFYPDQGTHVPKKRMAIHVYERAAVALKKAGIIKGFKSMKSPALFKVPLVKWRKGLEYKASTHVITPIKLSPLTGVLAHFKFFSDFHDRVVTAVKSKTHANGSAEYREYLKHMDKVKNFKYAGSRKYSSSRDVLESDLMKTTVDYDRKVAGK
jgi:hypothetical protein